MSRTRRRATIVTAAAASVVAGVALLPNWSAGASAPAEPEVDARTKATFQRLADAVFTDRTNALVDKPGDNGKKPLIDGFSGEVAVSSGAARTEDDAVDRLGDRKEGLARLGEKYSAANTSVTLDHTSVRGRKAVVKVTETTTLTYEKVRGDEPRTTGFQAHHRLTFQADRQGNWRLTDIRETDDGYLAVNQTAKPKVAAATKAKTDTMPSAPRAAITRPAPSNPKNLTAGGYDYKAMAAYAEKYWTNYNPDYPDFNGQGAGGDCTNFVSQSLKAGGWKHVPGYVYDYTRWFGNADIQSHSFVGVNEWSWFALNSKRVTSLANVYQMDVGDVLQIDFDKDGSKDHTMIVTYRSRQGVPYLTYHSTNTYRRSVASIIASYPNAAYYAYRT
ncbi:amidase domain-containing protein [Streptomyces spinoverrucosus]|uniref:amidase domain-containing protein n=1 Tax=Streptomyces spinoverrucosus TaxID=284043 RepID=UPI001E51E3F0|nr:amidase domain-containing protein [Streptomyces spinoverrucosus]